MFYEYNGYTLDDGDDPQIPFPEEEIDDELSPEEDYERTELKALKQNRDD